MYFITMLSSEKDFIANSRIAFLFPTFCLPCSKIVLRNNVSSCIFDSGITSINLDKSLSNTTFFTTPSLTIAGRPANNASFSARESFCY